MNARVRIATTILALTFAACGASTQALPSPTAATTVATATATPAPTPATITVSDAWARAGISAASDGTGAPMASATPGMGGAMGGASGATGATGNSAIYMTIKNSGPSADRLVKAACDAAGSTELHTAAMVNGVMQMRPVEAIDVPATGVATLAPGGFHVMLIGLKQDLKAGDSVKVTLTFERFGPLTIIAPVRVG
jgi:copper(I)-binding protein